MIVVNPYVDFILDFTSRVRYRLRVLDIGTFNMQGSYNFLVAHGLVRTSIKAITGFIRDDGDTVIWPFNTGYYDALGAGTYIGPAVVEVGGDIIIMHAAGSPFDGAGYSSILINRGEIHIVYQD